jgi:hypothetical protein
MIAIASCAPTVPMRRQKRFTFLAANCLVLAVAFVALQVRTYWVGYYISYGFGNRPKQVFLSMQNGSACFGWETLYVDNSGWNAYPIDPFISLSRWMGFAWSRYPDNLFIAIPFWFLASMAVGISWYLWKRRKPPEENLCHNCGYDLRASTERCPECGTPITSVVTS